MTGIRPYGDEYEADWLRLLNGIRATPLSIDEFRDRDRRWPASDFRCRLCAGTSGVAAIGQVSRSPYLPADCASVLIVVEPASRGNGVGAEMLQALAAAAKARGYAHLAFDAWDSDRELLQWAHRRGFQVHAARLSSTLDLDASSAPPHQQLAARALGREVAVRSAVEVGVTDGIAEFLADTVANAPDMAGLPKWDTVTARSILEAPGAGRRDWILVALRDEDPVGIAVMHDHRAHAYLHFYGVDAQFQGLGLATKMAATLCERARAAGFSTVKVDNLSSNAAALKVAHKLGFKTCARRLDLRLAI